MSRSIAVTSRDRRLAARAALHVFAAELGIRREEADPAELLGQLLAGLLWEAREASGGHIGLWAEAVDIMGRLDAEDG